MKTIRWGIIGCGDVTEVKSGPAFQKARNSELAAVMRRNGALAEDYAIRHSVPKWYTNSDELIRDPGVNAVYIATPPSTHKEFTLSAIRQGKPVLVEKPMSVCSADAAEMADAAATAHVPLFTSYYRRALPRYVKIKELIDSGAIGNIQRVAMKYSRPALLADREKNAHWRVDPAIAGAGYFFDLGSHMIDLIQFFCSPITEAEGSVRNRGKLYDAEDYVSARFICSSGVEGKGEWDFFAQEHWDVTEIIGSDGTIMYSTFSDGSVTVARGTKTQSFDIPNPPHVHQPLIQSIVDELLGEGTCSSTALSGSQTNWVLDKILGRII